MHFATKPLIKILVSGAIILGVFLVVYFFFFDRAREYFIAEFHSNTGIAPMKGRAGMWGYGEKNGHVTLVLRRGKPHSTVSTSHGWWEVVSLEWPSQPTIGRVDLSAGKVTVGFASHWGRMGWVIGKKGVRGYLDIESIEDNAIVASYDITLDVTQEGRAVMPEHGHREVNFGGYGTFVHRTRPEEPRFAAEGKLFPK